MTKKRNTKRALMASLLSMVMCTSMLIGSTFAWFTDNATTNVNTIQSGKLDIQLLDKDNNDLEGKTLEFADANGNTNILFEPGATFRTNTFKVHQNGNLEFKYDIQITGIEGDAKLLEVLDFKLMKVIDEENVEEITSAAVGHSKDFQGTWQITYDPETGRPVSTMIAGMDSEEMYLQAHMKETAGNEYQDLSLKGIAITVRATQNTVEFDSIGDQYDAAAEFDNVEVVTNQEQLNGAIANANGPTTIDVADGTYTLSGFNNAKDITFKGSENAVIEIPQGTAAANASITFDGVTVQFAAGSQYTGMQHSAKETYLNCTIIGQQFLYAPEVTFVNCVFENSGDNYCVWTYGTNATFTNCTFNCDGKAVLIYTEGEVTKSYGFNNCTFNDNGTISGKAAIEVGESAYGNKANYTIYVDDCTVNGFDVTKQNANTFGGDNLGTNVWGNKNLIPADRLNVIIDGVEVY